MFLFDTDHLGILQSQSEPECGRLAKRLAQHDASEFFISIVSFHEQIQGWHAYIAKARSPDGVVKGYGRLEYVLTSFAAAQIAPFDVAAQEVFEDLRSQRVRIGTMDLRIASIAIANSLILLTRNTVDFEKVPDLQFEDWTLTQ